MAVGDPPSYVSTINVTNSTLTGDTTWTHNNKIPDFRFSTTISNDVRKHEPEQFYLVVEMLCAHMKKFKGDFPGRPGLTYDVQIDESTPNELSYQIIFRQEEQ